MEMALPRKVFFFGAGGLILVKTYVLLITEIYCGIKFKGHNYNCNTNNIFLCFCVPNKGKNSFPLIPFIFTPLTNDRKYIPFRLFSPLLCSFPPFSFFPHFTRRHSLKDVANLPLLQLTFWFPVLSLKTAKFLQLLTHCMQYENAGFSCHIYFTGMCSLISFIYAALQNPCCP